MAALAWRWSRFGNASRMLAVLWTQQRCSTVSGKRSPNAAQNPNAPLTTPRLGPRLGRFPTPIGTGEECLGAVGFPANDDETAQPVLGQPDPEMDPVGPHLHIVRPRQIPPRKRLVFVRPGLDESGDRRS